MYCKYNSGGRIRAVVGVLIVAKCIVNLKEIYEDVKPVEVLIVAKCIVNYDRRLRHISPVSY